jgi:HD superfamily phosphohydrolase YqeK
MSEKTVRDKKYYAHSVEGSPPEGWHRLEDHLKNVAEMARRFANDFHAGDWGYLAGLWHDFGKYSDDPQIPFAHVWKADRKENGKGWNK